MRFVRRISLSAVVLFAVMATVSCGLIPFLISSFTTTGGSTMTFDLGGAKAIAGTTSSQRGIGMSKAMPRNATNGSLVKILENGDLQSIISMSGNGTWSPDVSFISTGDDGSIYICFQWPFYSEKGNVQFVRVHNTAGYPYDVLWPLDPMNYNNATDGTVCVWNWWGIDTDPLARGDDGKLYFKVTIQNGGNNPDDSIWQYDPVSGGLPVRMTPANANMQISRFFVDKQNHVFIQSEGYGGQGTSSFLRYYSPCVTAPTNIYYSSSNSVWVRGFTTDPVAGDSLIMNGYNINGMSGIIKASNLGGTPAYTMLVDQADPNYSNLGCGSNIGKMFYSNDGSLYALYGSDWWGGSNSGTGIVKLLNSSGANDWQQVAFSHGAEVPTKIKTIGDWVYYRYAILNAGQETGNHRLARRNLATGIEEEVFTADVPVSELLTYDVSDDNALLYFVAFDSSTNSVFGGKVDLATKAFSRLTHPPGLSSIRIVK